MSRHHIINGIKVDFTEEEEKARDAEEKEWADGSSARAFSELRSERNIKLADTDWRATSDLTLSDEWKAYRKLLRDFPSTLNDTTVLNEITWPEEPA
jgi:hypothetical protein